MILDISNSQKIVEYTEELESYIHRCIETVLTHERIDIPVEVSIVLTDNEGIRELNCNYRKIDSPTDVLSFPLTDEDEEISLMEGEEAVALGDIVISMEKTKSQAEEYGHSFLVEFGFLLIHGMLHLLGYDHIEHEDEIHMTRHEKEIMNALLLDREDFD